MASMSDTPASKPLPPAAAASGLGRWARDYAEDLRRFLTKRRIVESDIKDVCQEVYLRLLRFERAEMVMHPQAYLFRVAANVAHDFKLRQRRWQPLEAAEPEDLRADTSPEQLAELAVRHRKVGQALASLPPLARAALALQMTEDLTYEQIAERLGTTRRSVKRAVANGYGLLRTILADI